MLEDINGAEAIMNDILIAGKDKASHDAILKKVLQKAADYNLKLNFQKCKIGQTSVKYCGHLITQNGILPDPDKVQALSNMPPPQDKVGVKRFLGLVTYLGKFIPNLSAADVPLRALLKESVDFEWSQPQENSFR